MNFDDSFFEDDSDIQNKEDKTKKANNEYNPKICEPEVYCYMISNLYNIVYF